jgi:hypothetical protein
LQLPSSPVGSGSPAACPHHARGNVKILIGIYQNRKDLTHFSQHRRVDVSSLQEVGPFFSREQALSWMGELRDRIDSSEIALLPDGGESLKKWYGFTFEEAES